MATFPEALNGYDAGTPANNTPAGSDSVGTQLDDHLRDIKANIKNAGALTPSSTATAAVTMVATDFNKLLLVDPSAAARTVSVLTAAAALAGFRVGIKNVSGANNVIVHRSASNTIDGEASITLSATNQAVMLACNGTTWYRTSAHTPITAATLTPTRGFLSGRFVHWLCCHRYVVSRIPDPQNIGWLDRCRIRYQRVGSKHPSGLRGLSPNRISED